MSSRPRASFSLVRCWFACDSYAHAAHRHALIGRRHRPHSLVAQKLVECKSKNERVRVASKPYEAAP
jgi:hypothetical protein